MRTVVLFCTHQLSPPPSEKVDLPRSARFGAFFLALKQHPVIKICRSYPARACAPNRQVVGTCHSAQTSYVTPSNPSRSEKHGLSLIRLAHHRLADTPCLRRFLHLSLCPGDDVDQPRQCHLSLKMSQCNFFSVPVPYRRHQPRAESRNGLHAMIKPSPTSCAGL